MKTANFKKIIFFSAILGLLVFFHFVGVLGPVESFFRAILNKPAGFFYSLSSSFENYKREKTGKEILRSEIEVLKKKTEKLLADNSRLKKLEEENSKLRQHLKFLEENKFNYSLANVVARGFSVKGAVDRGWIIIDRGEKDGLVKGLAVLDELGLVVGKIEEVKENISQVSLITGNSCRLAVSSRSSGRTIGATSGELNLTVKLNFVPQTEKIKKGDLVVTSGLEINIPRGLLLGEISEVSGGESDVWQSAILLPAADLDNLTIVSVLLPR